MNGGESWRQYAVTLPPKTMLLPSGVLTLTNGHRIVGDDLMCPTAALERARKVAGESGGVVVVRDVQASEWRPAAGRNQRSRPFHGGEHR